MQATDPSQTSFFSLSRIRQVLGEWYRKIITLPWNHDIYTLSRFRKFAATTLKAIVVAARGLLRNQCTLRASSLTFFSLLSLVPVLALLFSVAKGIGAQEKLMEFGGIEQVADSDELRIKEKSLLAEYPTEVSRLAEVVFRSAQRANVQTLGTIGMLVLLYSVIKVMSRIENTFNTIWQAGAPRSYVRKLADYLSVVMVVPILILLVTSVNGLVTSAAVSGFLEEKIGPFYAILDKGVGFSGIVFIVIAFSFLYLFLPNVRVRLLPALAGAAVAAVAAVAGVAWYFLQVGYFFSQAWVTKYNAVYGTFAVVPFFLIWLNLSWILVLVGAELSQAFQNHDVFSLIFPPGQTPYAVKESVGLLLTLEISHAYYARNGEFSVGDFEKQYALSRITISDALVPLSKKNILVQVSENDERYIPGVAPEDLTVGDVKRALAGTIPKELNSKMKNNFQDKYLNCAVAFLAEAADTMDFKTALDNRDCLTA